MIRPNLAILGLASIVVVCSIGSSAYAQFPGTSITPSIYQVTVKQVQLCTGSDGIGSCQGALLIGSGSKGFDIASAGAGAQVGNYANLSNLPLATRFTHVQVTVDSAIVIRALGTDTVEGAPSPCSSSASGGGSASAASTANFPATTPENETVFVPHVGSYNCCGTTSTLTESQFQVAGRGYIKRPNDSDVVITYPLPTAFTPVAGQKPQVTVKFDVTRAVGVFFTGTACQMFPEPPGVTISVN